MPPAGERRPGSRFSKHCRHSITGNPAWCFQMKCCSSRRSGLAGATSCAANVAGAVSRAPTALSRQPLARFPSHMGRSGSQSRSSGLPTHRRLGATPVDHARGSRDRLPKRALSAAPARPSFGNHSRLRILLGFSISKPAPVDDRSRCSTYQILRAGARYRQIYPEPHNIWLERVYRAPCSEPELIP